MADPISGEHVLRRAWSETDNAVRTVPASSTTFAIELDAADGDNILTKPDNNVVTTDTTVSVVGMKTLCLYGTCTTVEVSPQDSGGTFYTIIPTALTPMTICARRLRTTGLSGAIVVQAV